MPGATWAVGSFLGGELSEFAQGRFDKPDYRTSLKVCLNAFPVEIGTWTRRPGTKYAGHARVGAPGRIIKFDYEQSEPNTLEFTDGFMRARSGATLITTNDSQVVVAVSAANPAVVQTTTAHGWLTGNTVVLPGASTPLLENRQFTITVVDTTHFSLSDALTGASIDGSTLGTLVANANVERVLEIATVYIGGAWSTLRAVQAETTSILLNSGAAPQALTVTALPTGTTQPTFAIAPASFQDGPYLDPVTGGAVVTPSAKNGNITLTISFTAYDSGRSYSKGDFVVFSSINYQSLTDANVGNQPDTHPGNWTAVSAGLAVGPNGFTGNDIGRLVRLFSEPDLWAVGTTYSTGQFVSYNPSNIPGQSTYWISLVSTNTGNVPGNDTTHWAIAANAAIWSWGKIIALANLVSGTLAGSVNIGTLTQSGGLTAAFDGTTNKSQINCATLTTSVPTDTQFAGKNYSGASAQKIGSATVYPSSDQGFVEVIETYRGFDGSGPFVATIASFFTLTMYAKHTAPVNGTDGTVIGQSTSNLVNTNSPVTITSTDQTTSWEYVWVTISYGATQIYIPVSFQVTVAYGQVQFFSPAGTGTGAACTLQVLGAALLYTSPVRVWRLGVYSNTTGWPTCGCYHEGRLWLGGAVANRWDASISNGISGTAINFAPTAQSGAVLDSSAISYVFNSDGVNPIYWMVPDLQGVIMGTLAGEWLVQAPTTGPITANNVAARRVTKIGSANVEPRHTEHTLILVKRYFQKIMEYFADVFSGKFSAPNLAEKAAHITSAQVQELAYTDGVSPILWGRNADGSWFGVTYKRDTLMTAQGPTYAAWHRHTLGSGRIVESIAAGPSVDGQLDALTMVTTDGSGGAGIRHVEVLTDVPSETAALTSAWFLDDAVNPTSIISTAATLTINGLWHLNGKTVQVFAGGLDCGDPGEGKPYADFVVSNGSVTITYGDGISAGAGRGLLTAAFVATLSLSEIVVGFTYDSEGQTVRPIAPADSGARNGPAFAKLTRGHRFGMKLVNTLGLSIGGDLDKPMYACRFVKGDGVTNIDPLTTFSGIHQDALRDDYGYEGGCLAWRVSRPFPANVVAVGNNLMTQDQ